MLATGWSVWSSQLVMIDGICVFVYGGQTPAHFAILTRAGGELGSLQKSGGNSLSFARPRAKRKAMKAKGWRAQCRCMADEFSS